MNITFDMCSSLTTADWIQIVIAFITLISIIVSIIIAIKTLKHNSKMIENSTRAYILFYIDYHPQTKKYYLVIKNFGKTAGKLIKLNVSPKLNWELCEFKQTLTPLTESKNVLLTPNQKISSWFDFDGYPDKQFDIYIEYSCNNKIYNENYSIDLSYIDNHEWLHKYSFDDTTDDYKKVLYQINNSILELSENIK